MENLIAQSRFFAQISDIQVMLDHIPGVMFMIKDLDSRYIYMSGKLRESIDLASDQKVVGKTDFDIFPRIVAERFRQNDLLVFREGRTLVDEIHATSYYSGPTQWFFSSKFPLRNHEGDIVGLITINRPYDEVVDRDSELNRLLPVIEFIKTNYAEKITIADMARLCFLSESHFMRLFKQLIKMTAHGYLEQVRMFHAMDQIKHRSVSIAAIAQNCGFYDHSSFVKRFKKVTGTTPLRYRQLHQSRNNPAQPVVLPELTAKR